MDIPSLESSIPTGSWTLYYHHPADHRWTMDSYQKIVTIKTWGDFFSCMKALEESIIQSAMLFWMRGDVPPLYENHNNIRGGCYSLRINRSKSNNYFLLYSIACLMGTVVSDNGNVIQGISISPKRVIEKSQVCSKEALNKTKDLLSRLTNLFYLLVIKNTDTSITQSI